MILSSSMSSSIVAELCLHFCRAITRYHTESRVPLLQITYPGTQWAKLSKIGRRRQNFHVVVYTDWPQRHTFIRHRSTESLPTLINRPSAGVPKFGATHTLPTLRDLRGNAAYKAYVVQKRTQVRKQQPQSTILEGEFPELACSAETRFQRRGYCESKEIVERI
jgi:hypothetical protein